MIVESTKDIQVFLDEYNTHPSIIIPIHTDLDTHPIPTPISFLYVRIEGQSYILPFDHTDCSNIEIDLSQSTQPKWMWDKKTILQTNLGIQDTHDIQTHYFFTHNHLYPLLGSSPKIFQIDGLPPPNTYITTSLFTPNTIPIR